MSFGSLGSLVVSIIANTAGFTNPLDRAAYLANRFATQTDRDFARMASGIDSSIGKVNGALGGLVGGISAVGFGLFIKGAIDAADNMRDLSSSTGIATETLAGLQMASKQSGAELDSTAKAINKLSVNMAANAEKFAAIGITAKDPLQAFKQLSDIFVKIEDPQLRAAVAAEALGKGWAGAAPLLAEGSQRIQEMVDKGTALSGVTQQFADDSDAFNDNVVELQTALSGVATQMASSLLPLMTAFTEELVNNRDEVGNLDVGFDPLLETLRTVIVLGGNVAFVMKGIGTEIGGLAAQLALMAQGEFSKAFSIGDEMKADAEKARASFDAWEERMMSAGKAARSTADDMAKVPPATKAQTDAFRNFVKEAEDAADAYDAIRKRAASFVEGLKKETDQLGLTTTQKKMVEAATIALTLRTPAERLVVMQAAAAWAEKATALELAAQAAESANRAAEEAFKQEDDRLAKINDGIKGLREMVESINEEAFALKASASAIREHNIMLALQRSGLDASSEAFAEMKRQLEAAYAGLADAQAFKAMEDSTVSFWQNTEKLGRDTFTSWVTGAEDTADRMKKAIQSMFFDWLWQAASKPIMFDVVSRISGGQVAERAFGVASGSGGGSSIGLPGAGLGNVISGVGNMIGSTSMSAFGTGMGLSTSQAAAAAELYGAAGMGEVGGALSAGAGVGAALPYIGLALAAASALGLFEGDGPAMRTSNYVGRFGETANGGYNYAENHWFSSSMGPQQEEFDRMLQEQEQGLIKSLGLTAEQVERINARIAANAGKQYEFGMEFTDTAISPAIMIDRIVFAIQELDESWAPLLRGILDNTGAQGALQAAQAFGAIDNYGTKDPFAAAEMAEVSSRTLMSAYMAQRDVVDELVATYDGSLGATLALADATTQRYAMELELATQINQVMQSVHDSVAANIRTIEMSVLDAAGQYEYLDKEAQRYRDTLATLTDPTLIEEYGAKLQKTIMDAYNLLSPEQQQATSGEFIERLRGVEDLVGTRLDASEAVVVAERQELSASIKEAILTAVGQAAEALTQAAQTPHVVQSQVTFTANIPGTAEVYAEGNGG